MNHDKAWAVLTARITELEQANRGQRQRIQQLTRALDRQKARTEQWKQRALTKPKR